MIGADIIDPSTQQLASGRIRDLVKEIARAGVVITKCGASTLRICPPLNITLSQANEGLEVVLKVLER